jgi:hypothetical protein
MLNELQPAPCQWEVLMADYIERAKIELGLKRAQELKGNLPKALVRDPLAFKSFCRGVSVFNFKAVTFRVCTRKNDKTTWSIINIPQTFADDGGKYLKILWNDLTAKWPEVTLNWPEYMARYKEKLRAYYNTDPSSVPSNLVRTLNEDQLTWRVFYEGMMVHDFDEITVQVHMERRAAAKPYVIELRIVN